MATSRTSSWLVVTAALAAACGGDDTGGGTAGGDASTSGDDTERARIDAERETLDACRLGRPCAALEWQHDVPPSPDDLACMWRVLTLDVAAGRFVSRTPTDGPCPCPASEEVLYVADGVAYLSRRAGPLRRCSIRTPYFFQRCLDAYDDGESADPACGTFEGWLEGCVNAEPACP